MKSRGQYTIVDFFKAYAFELTMTGMAARLGVDHEQLHNYISGLKFPDPRQLKAFEKAVHKLGHELLAVKIVPPEYKVGFTEMIRRAVRTPPVPPKKKK